LLASKKKEFISPTTAVAVYIDEADLCLKNQQGGENENKQQIFFKGIR